MEIEITSEVAPSFAHSQYDLHTFQSALLAGADQLDDLIDALRHTQDHTLSGSSGSSGSQTYARRLRSFLMCVTTLS